MAKANKTIKGKNEFALTVKRNLETLSKQRKNGKKVIADACGKSQAMVTKWTTNEPALPSADSLYYIAKEFGVTVDWLLSDHKDNDMMSRISTYSDGFIALIPLVTRDLIQADSIDEPILRYLLKRYEAIMSSSISEAKYIEWLHDIILKFNIPLAPVISEELCSYFINTVPDVKCINDDETYMNLANLLQDEAVVAAAQDVLKGPDPWPKDWPDFAEFTDEDIYENLGIAPLSNNKKCDKKDQK